MNSERVSSNRALPVGATERAILQWIEPMGVLGGEQDLPLIPKGGEVMGVIPLAKAKVRSRYLIVKIASNSPILLGRLTGLGIFPGTEIFMSQKIPALVIRAGETDVALEREVATEILVRALP